MEHTLAEIATEIEFILARHSANLSRFKALFGIIMDPAKYLEIFEQTLISAREEIMEVIRKAVERNISGNPRFKKAIELIVVSNIDRFILGNSMCM